MHIKNVFFIVFLFCSMLIFSCKENTNIPLTKGMTISRSVTIASDTFRINGDSDMNNPVISIQGNDITIDFQGAVLLGSNDKEFPNEYYGIGLEVRGVNIKIKNLNVHGFRIGLSAERTGNLIVSNSNFSYNFRSRSDDSKTNSLETQEYIKTNHYLAGVTINDSKNTTIKNCRITNLQTGILIDDSNGGRIYNNTITHNSNSAIRLVNSNHFEIMHNYLDWNILNDPKKVDYPAIDAGYSSKYVIVAHNSITHSSDIFVGPENFLFENYFYPPPPDSIVYKKISPLPDGQEINPDKYKYKGEKYILTNEWGPYDFEYPAIWLREINDDKYTFSIFGPEGNWKIIGGNGFVKTSSQSGSSSATIVATKAKDFKGSLSLELEFIGVEFTDQFGKKNSRGKTFKFGFQSKD